MRARSRVVAATVLVVLAACSGGGDGDDDGSAAPTSAVPAPGECLPRSATVARATPVGDEVAYLLDARVTRLDACADEVAFEFRSPGRELPPGYEIAYEAGPTFVDYTSADEFDMTGGAFLVVRFLETVAAELVEVDGELEGRSTFDLGRESITPSGMNHLQEARIVQGPEGVIQWVIGLDSERPFTVDASTYPVPLPSEAPATVPTTTTSAPDTTTSSTTTTTLPAEATSQVVIRIG
ncbi:MAG TPA: hypothetical protein VF152_16205 [Acidimicrobiia bacterium]